MWALVHRDLLMAWRRRSESLTPIMFLLLLAVLFPLSLGSDRELLSAVAPGVIWVAVLLAGLLSLEQVFRSDFRDGSLEQMLLSKHSMAKLSAAKVGAHWLVANGPLILIAPVVAIALNMSAESLPILMAALLLATPTLSFLGAIGASLSVGLQRGGMFLSILVLPLYVPVLIFATSATANATVGLPALTQLKLLAALLILAVTLCPFAIAAAARISVSSQ